MNPIDNLALEDFTYSIESQIFLEKYYVNQKEKSSKNLDQNTNELYSNYSI